MAGTNTPRFQRANYVVRDIDQSLELYRDVLGFEVAFILDSPDDSYSYPVFEIDRSHSLRFAVLSAPGQPRVMALTEVPGEIPAVPFPRRAAIVIDVHVRKGRRRGALAPLIGQQCGFVTLIRRIKVNQKCPAADSG